MRLAAVQGDGATLRTHLQRLHRNTGRLDPLLAQAAVPLPAAVAELWQAFVALSGARGGGEVPQPIACTEIEAWCRLHGVHLTPWEAETLLQIDRALRAMPRQRPDLTE